MPKGPNFAFASLTSVFAKCLTITAVTALIIAATLSYNGYKLAVDVASGFVGDMARISTNKAAESLSSPVNFESIGMIEGIIDTLIVQSEGLTDGALVTAADGRVLFKSPGMSETDTAALATLSKTALQDGVQREDTSAIDIAVPITFSSGEVIGVVAFDWSTAQIVTTIQSSKITDMIISFALLAALLLGSTFFLTKFLRTPMRSLEGAVQKITDGDLDTPVSGVGRSDEIGRVAHHLEVMRASLADARAQRDIQVEKQREEQEVMQIMRQALKSLAGGDLTVSVTDNLPQDYRELGHDFNETASAFHGAMGKVVTLAERIRHESNEIGKYSDDLSQRTENQAATLEETAAALDELTNSVRGAADGAREVEGIVSTARTEATKSGEVVQKTIDAMSEIEQSSSQISAIIAVIDDIAFQTNLLALNAGVEAARAGDAGRGFAVVASEVRALAQRSSEAAQEIKTLIGGSSAHVSNGVKLVAQAGTALTAITDRVVQIASLMSDMAQKTQEQSTNLNEINSGVGNLDQVTQRNASMVEEANAASITLLGQSEALSQLVTNFKIGDPGDAPFVLDQRVA